MWSEAGQKEPEAFGLLHQALGWCQKYKLRAVVDLHILRSHYFNAKEKPLFTDRNAQERFFQCWRDLSGELKKYPNTQVAYELMNEPVADDAEIWNKLVGEAIAVIREQEPRRTIVVGSNRWQSPDEFDALRVPANDRYILLSFHFYSPFLLTHHQASWTDIGAYKGPVHYPGATVTNAEMAAQPAEIAQAVKNSGGGSAYDVANIEGAFQEPLAFAKKHQLPLYCGEWGCLNTVPEADRLRWYRDVKNLLEKHQIGWANWDYKGNGFGIVDNKRTPKTALTKILTGK
jgi:endoglucanase